MAREAGVAASTVSRAFREPGLVNEETRSYIIEISEQLGYRAHKLRGSSSDRVRTIALVISDVANPHYFAVIRGAEQRAAAAGLLLILVNTEESAEIEQRRIDQLATNVDAYILASSRLTDDAIRRVSEHHVTSLVSRRVSEVPSVIADYQEGSRQAVEHLVTLGHHHLAFLAGPRTSWLGARRWESISHTARDLGAKATRLGPFPANAQAGIVAADAAIKSGASAAIAHNDLLAFGVMQRLRDRGIVVPDEISVVGFDNIFASDLCHPRLTTVAGAHQDMGRYAVELVIESSGSQGPDTARCVTVPSQLIVRESTGELPVTRPRPSPATIRI